MDPPTKKEKGAPAPEARVCGNCLTPAVNPASPAPPVPPEPAAAADGHELGMGAEAPQQLSKGQMKRRNRKAKADAKAKATAAPPWPASAGAPIQENGVESPRADLVAHDDYPPPASCFP